MESRISLISILTVVHLLFTGCSDSERRIKQTFAAHISEFDSVVKRFSTEEELNSITISESMLSINDWYYHPDHDSVWSRWVTETATNEYLNSIDAVLKREHLSKTKYIYYRDFLMKYQFEQLDKLNEARGYVTIEIGLHGLYFTSDGSVLSPDHEYFNVDKLNDYWYYYKRDWN